MTDLAVPPWAALLVVVALVVLGVAVVVLAVRASRAAQHTEELLIAAARDTEALRDQLAEVQQQLRAGRDVAERAGSAVVARTDDREYVITEFGDRRGPLVPARALPAPQFADVLLRESLVRSVSFTAGLRRALSPEVRNRIRFEMKREIKRSRKARKRRLRQVRRSGLEVGS